ncbi:MAG: SAM-dependent methyltransferase, partial [bacterium]
LAMNWHSANTNTRNAVAHIQSRYGALPDDYQSEINLRLQPWLQTVSRLLAEGIVLLIDYGYEGAAYYHPERDTGTLICHSRHRAHDDVFYMPGLQDITANVDFSQVAEAGSAAGLDLLGYTTQANFLIGCGLDEILMEAHQSNPAEQINLLQGVKQLTLPTEMGERFKVIALGREIDAPLRGFAVRDLRGRL